MLNHEEINSRVSNLVQALEATIGRVNRTLTTQELEEIGYLTMRMAAVEESLSVCCEILLMRPELGGFHPHNKPVLTKQFSEKLKLISMLIRASGTLYGIDIGLLEKSVVAVANAGEDRNAVIHGLLSQGQGGEMAFRIRGRDVPAALQSLRELTGRCQEGAFDLFRNFHAFYSVLVGKKSIAAAMEGAFLSLLESWMKVHGSLNVARKNSLTLREAEEELARAKAKAEESRARVAEAKKVVEEAKKALRKAKARTRRKQKRDALATQASRA